MSTKASGAGLLLALSLSLWGVPALAQTTEASPTSELGNTAPSLTQVAASASVESPLDVRLLEAIRHARQILQQAVDDQLASSDYKPRVVSSKNAGVEVILALWNPDGNQFDLVRVWKQGRKITPITGEQYEFTLKTDNGVNSEFVVSNRPDLYVVGLIHPVFSDIGTAARPRYRLGNAAYVPNSAQLRVPAVVAAGEEYLERKINAVYDELRQLKVSSRAKPGELLADVIDPAAVKTIIAIEHVSATALITRDIKDYLDAFYTILAGNEHRAYAYARSSASARGLAQFIPSTYTLIRRAWPELGLHTDFEQGMIDPYNAIKAQVALMDSNLAVLPGALRQQYATNWKELGAYVAAMYNGGPARVKRAIAAHGEAWDTYYGLYQHSLRQETVQYVKKYYLVYDHFASQPLRLAAAAP